MKQCPRITVLAKEDQTYLVVSDTKKYVLVVFKKSKILPLLPRKRTYGQRKIVLIKSYITALTKLFCNDSLAGGGAVPGLISEAQ